VESAHLTQTSEDGPSPSTALSPLAPPDRLPITGPSGPSPSTALSPSAPPDRLPPMGPSGPSPPMPSPMLLDRPSPMGPSGPLPSAPPDRPPQWDLPCRRRQQRGPRRHNRIGEPLWDLPSCRRQHSRSGPSLRRPPCCHRQQQAGEDSTQYAANSSPATPPNGAQYLCRSTPAHNSPSLVAR